MKRSFFIACSIFALVIRPASAADHIWSGGSVPPTNVWSDPNNFDGIAFVDGDSATFANAGSVSSPGVVNNIVDSVPLLSAFSYKAQLSIPSAITNYHTTQINPGVTLTLDNGANSGLLLNVGDVDTALIDARYFCTIVGSNATLLAGNTNAPVSTQGMQVVATSQSLTNHIGSLDMSGLDNFIFAGGYVYIGASSANASGATDRPVGAIYLAKTNLFIANSTATDGSFRLGESKGNTPPRESWMELGQDNTIDAVWIKIGGIKNNAGNGGHAYFRSSLTNNNPILRLRGPDGVSRVTTLSVGDNNLAGNSSIGSKGFLDLTGGTFDALVDTAYVGRTTTSGTTGTAAATGTITWTAGTLDVNTLYLGYQAANIPGTGTGTLNLKGAAQLVAGSITMGRDAGSGTGTGSGTINITGGSATVSGTIAENDGSGGDGRSTINITNGLLSVGGLVTIDNLNLNNGVVSNASLLTATALKGSGSIYGPVTVVSNLTPGTTIGTLAISNSLTLSATSTSVFEMDLDALACDKVSSLTDVTFNGALTVTNIAGTSHLTNGTTFKLFEANTYSGTFTAMNLPVIGGVTWDTGSLGTSGTIKAVVSINTAPTNIVAAFTTSNIDLSWPGDHTGWRLQSQTNAPGIGLTTNWMTVANSSTTNHVILTIDPNAGSGFYRLIYP
jgi:hypothetical protein